MMARAEMTEIERRAITVSGTVQGVGFRPYVYGLASRLSLAGWVQNETGRVLIEVEGRPVSLDRFLDELPRRAPSLARIEGVRWSAVPPKGETSFRIAASLSGQSHDIFIAPDVATCGACLSELFDPSDRRYRYPFINCTHCGPRLTIVTGAPYDRERTTMAPFLMCADCRAEYENPADRRFHAQPVACPACGPALALLDEEGVELESEDAVAAFAEAVLRGSLGALKGLGGYHLVCDASNDRVVRKLRLRKHRDEKPFAVMAADAGTARALAELDAREEELLTSRARPIVLARRRREAPLAEAVAPGNPDVGVLLPYTPLHHLLMHEVAGRPLVMTSANRSDEPLVYQDDEVLTRLSGIAELFLTHDRPIRLRCDDSVTRVVSGVELPMRRSRGSAPSPVPLPIELPRPTLALGGQLKSTFALGRNRTAILSHHIGDLDDYRAFHAYQNEIRHFECLFDVAPEVLVHDRHPDYQSTRYALERGRAEGLPVIAVQHHHAHMASCMAENGLEGPVIGVTYDGTGYGCDETIWGGEVLVGDFEECERVFHLRPVPLPGGEQAIREPWRMALSHLLDAGEAPDELLGRIPAGKRQVVMKMIERELNAPPTSSMGRLFDAVSALVGLKERTAYEGQAAMELEWAAASAPPARPYPWELSGTTMDTRPLIRAIAADVRRREAVAVIARRFHATLVAMTLAACEQVREHEGVDDVVLSGGCFQNVLLLQETIAALSARGFGGHRHRLVPPNDGGLCLGQLAIAAARMSREM